jgi:hypothetical protein
MEGGIISLYRNNDLFSLGSFVTAIAMLAKIAVAGSFAIIYNFTAELYPTVVRNSAVGLCAMAARSSGMVTPQIILLVRVFL